MPRVKIDYIVSFSSEDPEHRAANLLAGEVSKKKWLCTKGEPSCSVVLQLTQAVEISAIHIGAYHAALVEVLVGLSERPNDPFQVLVPSCVFVPPAQSRRDEGVSRVRSFSGDELAADARGKRYDRVRIVCSQPYNKHCQYGLSFVHINEPETRAEPNPTPATLPPRLFALDTFSSDDEDFRPGELFSKHVKSPNNSDNPGSSSTGAQIRQATSNALKNISDSSTKLLKTPISKAGKCRQKSTEDVPAKRQRDDLMYTDDDAKPHDKIDRVVNKHKEQKTSQQKAPEGSAKKRKRDDDEGSSKKSDDMESDDESNKSKGKNTLKDKKAAGVNSKKNKDKDNKNVKTNNNKDDSTSKTSQGKKKDSSTAQKKDPESSARKRKRDNDGNSKKPDDKESDDKLGEECDDVGMVLRGVTLALSGYAGARRASLRETAIALGARYSPDWTPKCTHLICAFPNTPKLRTARASGAHVGVATGDWLDECLFYRRRLPWRWYATDPAERTSIQHDLLEDTDSDADDVDDYEDRDGQFKNQCDRVEGDTDEEIADSLGFSLPPVGCKRNFNNLEKLCGPDDGKDDCMIPVASWPTPGQAALPVAGVKEERLMGYMPTDSTDEDEIPGYGKMVEERIDTSKSLPDFFEGYTFVISDEVGEKSDRQILARYVRAFGGLIIPASEMYENSKVHYVVCSERGGAGEGPRNDAKRVRPSWVWRCARERRLCTVDGNS